MTYEGSKLLMNCGRDIEAAFSRGPNAVVRVDAHGWLGLTGEAGCADLNMAAVVHGASPALVDEYIGEIRDRGLDAILIVEQDEPGARGSRGKPRPPERRSCSSHGAGEPACASPERSSQGPDGGGSRRSGHQRARRLGLLPGRREGAASLFRHRS